MFLSARIITRPATLASLALLTIVCGTLPHSANKALAQLTSNQGKTVMIPAGTTFEGRIDQTLGSDKSHPGQKFAVTMASPALGNGQDIIIPAGSQFLGEVVEAISSGHQPHQKGYNKPTGKLRVQLTGLRIPDGSTFPIVASFAKDAAASSDIGTGVAYVGTQSSFNTLYPHGDRRSGPMVGKQAMLSNPLYGDPDKGKNQNNGANKNAIRSLVKKGNELIISSGAPMSIRLDAPLRLALAPISATTNPFQQGNEFTPQQDGSGRRFSHDPATAQVEKPKEVPAQAGVPLDGTPSFLTPVGGVAPQAATPNFTPPAAPKQSAPANSGSSF